MNKNFTPPSKKTTETVEKTLSIEPDRHFEVALQSGNCLDFNDECNFVKFARGLAFFQNHQNQWCIFHLHNAAGYLQKFFHYLRSLRGMDSKPAAGSEAHRLLYAL